MKKSAAVMVAKGTVGSHHHRRLHLQGIWNGLAFHPAKCVRSSKCGLTGSTHWIVPAPRFLENLKELSFHDNYYRSATSRANISESTKNVFFPASKRHAKPPAGHLKVCSRNGAILERSGTAQPRKTSSNDLARQVRHIRIQSQDKRRDPPPVKRRSQSRSGRPATSDGREPPPHSQERS